MIVILCDDFYQAVDRFYQFLEYLYIMECGEIRTVYEHAYCVETYSDLKYVFVDYRMADCFDNRADLIGEAEFFENLSCVNFY